MQYDDLVIIRKEISDDDFRYLINYVWFGFDDLTHDGYSVVDYDTELNFDYGDVLQHSDLDELRQVVLDREVLTVDGQAEDSDASMGYLRKLADTVDYLYDTHGPFYCRFDDGDTDLDITPLEREDEGFTYDMEDDNGR
jgi:hypothetical protein